MRKTSMSIWRPCQWLWRVPSHRHKRLLHLPSPVTIENYNRAQTDVNFAGVVRNGGFGKFRHGRELAPAVQQGIGRPNRDTFYSFAIVDLDAGPVTITLPTPVSASWGCRSSIRINTPRLPITAWALTP